MLANFAQKMISSRWVLTKRSGDALLLKVHIVALRQHQTCDPRLTRTLSGLNSRISPQVRGRVYFGLNFSPAYEQ